ncbi:MAG TPA: hypothetical protein VMW16_09065 [Sedimentisphaerales bacterium]|nr:hypothetical protein [Sedimentisphaerales bacterium]
MRPNDIEYWALSIIKRVESSQPVEDSRVELKAVWPEDHKKAARQIAGHANAAGGEPILWLIGVDEQNGVTGANYTEISAWRQSVEAKFGELPPSLSHLNYVVADTKQWEQSAAYYIDGHRAVEAFVKNTGLGLAIPYLDNGQLHDYPPDFIIRLRGPLQRYLILETKGFDPLESVKAQAAIRWVNAVNAERSFGNWAYTVVRAPEEIPACLDSCAAQT